MKVGELIALLGDLDADAEVYVMSQESWPFECAIAGIAQREEFTACEEDAAEAEEERGGDRWTAPDAALPPGDVFIVEGGQIRYGSKSAWEVARRR
jgi:hypothetical protein